MLRIGLFGLGRWGTNILNTLKRMKAVEVLAFDPTKKPAQPPLVRGGVYVPPDKGDLQGVIIATPGSTHAEVALPFIKAGIPTYIEKPLTTSLADARKLERAAKHSRALIFCGHIHLYNPAFHIAKKYAQKAGRLRYLYFEGTNNGPIRDDMSALWDWAPHDVYLAVDLMAGDLPTHVQAWGIKTLRPETNFYDFSVIKMTFPNDLIAISTTSWLSPEKRKKVTIVGEKDSIVFDENAVKKVAVYQDLSPIVNTATTLNKVAVRQESKILYPRYSNKSPLQAQLEAFIQTIKTGKRPFTDLDQGIAVVRVLAAAESSMKHEGRKKII